MNSKFYDNSIFANNLKRLLEDKGMTAAELARRMKISKSAVSDWLKGKSLPRTDKVDMICEILNCERDQFTKNTPSNILEITGLIPVIGDIAAGAPTLARENIIDYMPTILPNPDEYFALRVRGDSMIGAGIPDGACAVIHKQSCAEDGQIVACLINGDEATLKRFRSQGDSVILMPENSAYSPILVGKNDFESGKAQILGVLKEISIKY